MVKTFEEIAQRVLTIGPQYKNHRGGIGAVLATYADNIDGFKFVASYNGRYGSLKNLFVFIRSILVLSWTLLTDREITIVHIHGASKGSFYRKYILFLISKFVFRKSVIYHLHGGGFHVFYKEVNHLGKRTIRHLLKNVDIVICLSQSWNNYLSRTFEIEKVIVLNNPVQEPSKPSSVKLDGRDEKLRLLFLGLIGQNKGVFDLLRVLSQYKGNFVGHINLTIAGNGEVNRLQSFIKNHSLSELVNYVGWIDGEQKHKLLSNCEVLVLPSYNEGLPISILEAMSYGKAIVATNVGGIPEVVVDGENGFVINPGDLDALKKALSQFMDNKELLDEMGKNSLKKVQPYLISNVIKQLQIIYRENERLG